MIIWGSKGKEIELGRGHFHCPRCDDQRPYKHKRLAKYFTLYFIPLFQTENLAEYIECGTCTGQFKMEVLEYRPPSKVEQVLMAVRADLESGTPLEMMMRKLTNSGIDEQTAWQMVNAASGGQVVQCPACRYSFLSGTARCSNCGGPLQQPLPHTRPGLP